LVLLMKPLHGTGSAITTNGDTTLGMGGVIEKYYK
jgi:hypothetical protein